ncbi:MULTISPECIES: exosortase-associated protein EpsI, V-type [unclassified Sphingomonas]|uniref:exosortase-associated protein EpsI, V-type n=1 Tax=unclassified Sphingomonas TaxID=196159 RepID=UPI00092C1612|nr:MULTISPECIES: exosortase-associated protein EpsI, V-type [unclassified Sphingomonas]MBN8848687.1 EpsI family protein [Sphingomonas sp.]OJV28651.1 MAG: EpsI family protein [Sphingomonas sp. 67-36]
MIARREFLFAGGCAAALGTAEWLRPREMRLLLPANEKITNIVPLHFGSWQAGGGGDIVLPDVKDSLASMLYSDRVARSYRETAGDTVHDVMLLIAYGRSQSDTLQLHRPETCYPATGFAVTFHQLTELPIADGVSLPAVMLTAEAGDRVEDIIYWTRLGEKMPRTLTEQRVQRFETALHGYIADGVLVRASMIRHPDDAPVFPVLGEFMRAMVLGMKPANRPAMIGDTFARRLPA